MQLSRNTILTKTLYTVLLSSCLLASHAFAAPAKGIWTTMQGGPAHTGYAAQTTNPGNYHVIWSKTVFEKNDGDRGYGLGLTGQPLITDNNVYFTINHFSTILGDQHELIALNINTGENVWGAQFKDFNGISMPILSEGNLIVTLDKFNEDHSQLNVYQPETGKLKSVLQIPGTYWRDPIAYDGNLYLNAQEAMTSVDAATGLANWKINHNVSIVSPAISDNYLIMVLDEDRGHGIDILNRKTGELISSIGIPREFYHHPARRYPVLDEKNDAVYFIYRSNRAPTSFLHAFDLKKQAIKWVVPSVFNQVIVVDDDVYAIMWDELNKFQLVDINALTGEIKWTWKPSGTEELELGDAYNNAPVATSDVIFVAGVTKTYAISRATHQKVWEIEKTGTLSLGKGVLLINSTEHEKTQKVTAVALN